jgi:acyl-CoA thioesterase
MYDFNNSSKSEIEKQIAYCRLVATERKITNDADNNNDDVDFKKFWIKTKNEHQNDYKAILKDLITFSRSYLMGVIRFLSNSFLFFTFNYSLNFNFEDF